MIARHRTLIASIDTFFESVMSHLVLSLSFVRTPSHVHVSFQVFTVKSGSMGYSKHDNSASRKLPQPSAVASRCMHAS